MTHILRPSRVLAALLLCVASLQSHALELVSPDVQGRDHVAVRTVERIADLVRTRSRGMLDIKVWPNSVAGSEVDTLRGLQNGTIAMTRVSLAALEPFSKTATFASLPYLLRSESHMWKVLTGSFGLQLEKELEANGLIGLSYMATSPRNFICHKPIHAIADFRGRSIGGLGTPVLRALISELGATPVTLGDAELGQAFLSGKVDCTADETVNFLSVAKEVKGIYLIQDEHVRVPNMLVMSRKVWLGLTAEQQALLRDTAREVTRQQAGEWSRREAEAIAAARRRGLNVITREDMASSAIEEAAVKIYPRFVTRPEDLDAVLKIVGTH